MSHARAAILVLSAWASSWAWAAAVLDECPARTYKPCASFTTSRTIDEHTPLIDAATGFTRSKGRWTIHVSYGPSEKCAKVSVALDVGPLDFHRDYERVFRNGAGTISESGTFMHRTDDVEAGLRIATTRCRVPDDESERLDDDEQERREWEAERERLEWQAERERLALEAEHERQAQEAERQRLAREADRKRREAQRSLAQAKREREQERERERERERLAQERERVRAEAEAAELARMERQHMEMLRRKEQEASASTGNVLSDIATGLGFAALFGAAVSGDEEVLGAASQLLSTAAGGYSSGGVAGSNCEQIGLRMTQGLQRLNNSNSGMCALYRGTAQVYRQTRSELTAARCPMAGFDEAIRQAEAGARGACE